MSAPLDGIVTIEHEGKRYTATYRVIGGVVSVKPSVGQAEDMNIDNYDKPADVIARMVLQLRVDEHVKSSRK